MRLAFDNLNRDDMVGLWLVGAGGVYPLQRMDDFHPAGDIAKYGVAAIKVGCGHKGDEEL